MTLSLLEYVNTMRFLIKTDGFLSVRKSGTAGKLIKLHHLTYAISLHNNIPNFRQYIASYQDNNTYHIYCTALPPTIFTNNHTKTQSNYKDTENDHTHSKLTTKRHKTTTEIQNNRKETDMTTKRQNAATKICVTTERDTKKSKRHKSRLQREQNNCKHDAKQLQRVTEQLQRVAEQLQRDRERPYILNN